MKKVEIYFYISTKAFFGRNYRRIFRFWANLADFCKFLALNLYPLWLFMVILALKSIIINEKSRNTFLYIEKKTFFDQNSEKNEKKNVRFGGQFLNFLTPHSAQRAPNLYFLLSLSLSGKKLIKMICHMPF